MEHENSLIERSTKSYLENVGIRPTTKAYQYLLFALVQLQQNTPFKNTIWELTAIHFGQTHKNVLACVRREIVHACAKNPNNRSIQNERLVMIHLPTTREFLYQCLGNMRFGDKES